MGKLYPITILAGGLATRLLPISEKVPKALIEVANEPFISHQLKLLKYNGFNKVVICAWYRGKMIENYVGNGSQFGLEVLYSYDGDSPLGTGGAIKKALPLLGEKFFVVYGDSYLMCNYSKVQAAFERKGRKGLMTVFRNEGKWDTSNVEFSNGQILAYDKINKTPNMNYIDYGLGVFTRIAFMGKGFAESFDLAEVYQDLLSHNELAGYLIRERFFEIGSFDGLKELDELLSKKG